MMPTIIRTKTRSDLLFTVVTYLDPLKRFTAVYQAYRCDPDGRVFIFHEAAYSSEDPAIALWEKEIVNTK